MRNKLKLAFPTLLEKYRSIRAVYYNHRSQLLKRIPSKYYPWLLAKTYRRKTGYTLDWNHLETYNEKMQWSKMYHLFPLKATLSDKIEVKDWVADRIGEEYIIPTLAVWDQPEEIDWEMLPNQFALKLNTGSGCNLIVHDKDKVIQEELQQTAKQWYKQDFAYQNGFELHYRDIKPRVYAEEYVPLGDNLVDYRFFCFNGRVEAVWTDQTEAGIRRRDVYNPDWTVADWKFEQSIPSDHQLPKPQNYDKMLTIAQTLCQGFDHVRVDLYNIDGTIYFGEMTFTNGSGYRVITPLG